MKFKLTLVHLDGSYMTQTIEVENWYKAIKSLYESTRFIRKYLTKITLELVK